MQGRSKDRTRPSQADPLTPSQYAALEIDGQSYKLAYDFNAIAEAEEAAGCNLLHGISATLLNTMTAAQLRGLLYASLRRAQPNMTIAGAGSMIRLDTMPTIIEKISEAFALSMPRKKENPTEAGGAPARN